MTPKLGLSEERIARARALAEAIVAPVSAFVERHTSVTVERATLRLLGADGATADGIPVPNLVVDQLRGSPAGLDGGAAAHFVNGLVRTGLPPEALCARIAAGYRVVDEPLGDAAAIRHAGAERVEEGLGRVRRGREHREASLEAWVGRNHDPLLYVIVATGNIYEDVKQARAAALQGADVVAVIRTTAQSLLDYVPFGPTTEGFGGTYATQANFRIMRAALDEVAERERRYVWLTNYCSGLCMPEIAAMGALERLDMMLNDSMYGILFRDINMYRTFVDQRFSRMINAYAGITINTGEDNYLTTSDAFEKAFTVLASQFLNERFAFAAGLPARLVGLGHAMEMDPSIRGSFLYELAQAWMAREIFPEHPLKYMPPTKFKSGDVFLGLVMDNLFNFVSKASGQSIHLLGMLTEAIHTPFMMDRFIGLETARYVMTAVAGFADEVEFRDGGIVKTRAREVLEQTVAFLEEVERIGLLDAIERGLFADIGRPKDGGKGLEGLVPKGPGYWNPVEDALRASLGLDGGVGDGAGPRRPHAPVRPGA